MNFIVVIIIALVFLFFKSFIKNKVKEDKSFKMSDEFFEQKIIDTLDSFIVNYKVRLEDSNEKHIYSKSFKFKSEMDLEKFSRVMKNKIITSLENNSLMLKLAFEKRFLNKDSIEYYIPFCKEKYTLLVAFEETENYKIHNVILEVFDSSETD